MLHFRFLGGSEPSDTADLLFPECPGKKRIVTKAFSNKSKSTKTMGKVKIICISATCATSFIGKEK